MKSNEIDAADEASEPAPYSAQLIVKQTYSTVFREFRYLFPLVAQIAGAVFVLAGVCLSLLVLPGADGLGDGISKPGSFKLILPTLLFLCLAWVLVEGCTIGYIRLRRKLQAEDISATLVFAEIRRDFSRLVQTIPLAWLGITVGAQLCVVPGFILLAPLSLLVIIYTSNRRLSFSQSLSAAWSLLKNRHMPAFTAIFQVRFVAGLAAVISIVIASLPLRSIGEMITDEPQPLIAAMMVVMIGVGITMYQIPYTICVLKSYDVLRSLKAQDGGHSDPNLEEDSSPDPKPETES